MPGFRWDVIVIGAGAAGLMCAIEAGKRGRRVLVLERNTQIARKVLISGGGRCNFTNLRTASENFLSANPHFAKSALARYGPGDFLALVRTHHIPYHEKKLGQLFCDRSARDIVALLEAESAAAGVSIETGCEPLAVKRESLFTVATDRESYSCESLVVATGGLSIPKIGATAFGYSVARQFGLAMRPCRPALVPLVLEREDQERLVGLAGVSVEVEAATDSVAFRESMLFTHRGLSGPAILQLSSYWTPDQEITVDLLPDLDLRRVLAERRAAGDRSEVRAVLAAYLPKRLAAGSMMSSRVTVSLSDREIQAISEAWHAWRFRPAGTEGYAKAEVTAGGVDTAELSSKTFEARKVPGLYFIGEVLDVTGHLGGFNFQWAWASGHAAGQVV
jgi:predicted Rossmann fold flavoprotein